MKENNFELILFLTGILGGVFFKSGMDVLIPKLVSLNSEKKSSTKSNLDSEISNLEAKNKLLQDRIRFLSSSNKLIDEKVNVSLDAPKKFICPITQLIMEDPVLMVDGCHYERKAITTWFQNSDKSPVIPSVTLFNPRHQLTDLELQEEIKNYINSLSKINKTAGLR